MTTNKQDIMYFEDLGSVGIPCPHEDAFIPDGTKVYFRVLKDPSVHTSSFLPTPIKTDRPLPPDFDDCIGKSVSIYNDLAGMLNSFFKLPHNRGKKKQIGVLQLTATDGVLKQTFGKNHYSWWRSQAFDLEKVTVQEVEL
jgi:hypothetical protein